MTVIGTEFGNTARMGVIEQPTQIRVAGHWWATCEPIGEDGAFVQLAVPLVGSDGLYFGVEVHAPPGWCQAARDIVSTYQNVYRDTTGEEPSELVIPPAGLARSLAGDSIEVGWVDDVLGVIGAGVGAYFGGPGGAAAGYGLGNLAGGAIDGALEDSPAPRPASLPPVGSQANRARILAFVNIGPTTDAETARQRLSFGVSQHWDAGDLADGRAMLAALPASGAVDWARVLAAAPVAGGSQSSSQGSSQGLAQLLAGLGGSQGSSQGLAQLLGALGGSQGSSQGLAQLLGALGGSQGSSQGLAQLLQGVLSGSASGNAAGANAAGLQALLAGLLGRTASGAPSGDAMAQLLSLAIRMVSDDAQHVPSSSSARRSRRSSRSSSRSRSSRSSTARRLADAVQGDT